MTSQRCLIVLALFALSVPVWAGPTGSANESGAEPASASAATQSESRDPAYSTGSDIGWRGWGVRAGVTDDPDQVVGGVHFNLGEFVRHLRFQPDVQLGVGDDVTTIYGTAPVYYRFGTETRFTPYAGGGVSLGFVDRDLPASSNADDTDFEIGGKLTGGLEWPLEGDGAFFVELSLGFGDIHDAQIVAAWSF